MTSRARTLRDRWSDRPASRFERFDFHRPETLDALVEAVKSTAPPVIVLAGERGIGRGYLCEAAAHRVRRDGSPVAVWHLDLEGFEPDDPHPLSAYCRHLLEREQRASGDALDGIDCRGPASEIAAALVSLVLRFEEAAKRLAGDRLERPADAWSLARDAAETWRRLLDVVTAEGKLVIHLHDAIAVPVSLRRMLLHEAERRPDRIVLVLAAPADETRPTSSSTS